MDQIMLEKIAVVHRGQLIYTIAALPTTADHLCCSFRQVYKRIPYQDIAKLYMKTDLFAFLSISESFRHPLIEAIAPSGYSRCVPACSHNNRMADLIRFHEERFPGQKPG
jgi:hypothetical protein